MTTKITVSFESGRIEFEQAGSLGSWYFSFFTDTEGSYMSCDVSEVVLRSLIAFIDASKEAGR